MVKKMKNRGTFFLKAVLFYWLMLLCLGSDGIVFF